MVRNITFLLFASLLFVSCVSTGTHEKALKDLDTKKQAEINDLSKQNGDLKAEYEKLKKMYADLEKDREEIGKKFLGAMEFNDELKKKIESLGSSINELTEQQSSLEKEKEKERQKFINELAQAKKIAEMAKKRNEEYRNIMSKLQKMIDAGSLSVKIRKGRMIVSLSSDILFASGSASLTEEGKIAIVELSNTLKELPDRNFLVTGHSDSTPIRTSRFPSNWELSSQRAIEVVKLMVEAGVNPEMLSAAGYAEFDAIADNGTKEGKAQNRRVEIIFMPKIEELPGFTPESEGQSQAE